jgi:hypothetical protein
LYFHSSHDNEIKNDQKDIQQQPEECEGKNTMDVMTHPWRSGLFPPYPTGGNKNETDNEMRNSRNLLRPTCINADNVCRVNRDLRNRQSE